MRTGSEPLTAYSDLRLRLILSLIFIPLYAVGTLLLTVWWVNAEPGGDISPGAIGWAALICGVVAVIAIVDLVLILRRLRRGPPP